VPASCPMVPGRSPVNDVMGVPVESPVLVNTGATVRKST
jgi:hypothetical protein